MHFQFGAFSRAMLPIHLLNRFYEKPYSPYHFQALPQNTPVLVHSKGLGSREFHRALQSCHRLAQGMQQRIHQPRIGWVWAFSRSSCYLQAGAAHA
jgi:hypothetical protein